MDLNSLKNDLWHDFCDIIINIIFNTKMEESITSTKESRQQYLQSLTGNAGTTGTTSTQSTSTKN